jgi:hypothetical protein
MDYSVDVKKVVIPVSACCVTVSNPRIAFQQRSRGLSRKKTLKKAFI